MSIRQITESIVEEAALSWFEELGYAVLSGPDIAPGELFSERGSYGDVILEGRLRSALMGINPGVPAEAIEDAYRKLTRTIHESPLLYSNNYNFHRMLVDGVDVEYRTSDGRIAGDKVWLVDFYNADNNDWLIVNQFTVIEGQSNRRPDVIVFLNGLPVGVIELKNPGDEQATIKNAFRQIQTYKNEIPSLFPCNEILLVSDGIEARAGTLTADWEWFMPWRTIEGEDVAPKGVPELDVLIKGIFEKQRFLDLLRYFIVFEVDGAKIIKKMAAYHQFHAVNKAVECTLAGAGFIPAPTSGDRRIGVVWHTQGSGKSLTMAFYAGKIIQHPLMQNPTLVVLTDRNDLDDQLFGTFARCKDLLCQTPVQSERRDDLKELLSVASGGVVFTTIQKFLPEKGTDYPMLSDRRNIVVISDEAHRSQYDFIDGFARHMRDALPHASFIGFTGTPLEAADRNTPAVFGNYISIYDIQRAVEDGTTVRIYYEARLAKIELDEVERPKIDPEFEEVTEGEEEFSKERLKRKWAQLEAMVGSEKRIGLVAKYIVEHFGQRLEALVKNTSDNGGKGPDMLDSAIRQIVSRAIAADEVVDIFASAGIKKPDISILSDEFLEEVRHMPQRNLALEVLKKLLNDEIRIRSGRNLVQARSFSEMLEQTIRKYQNRTIEAAQVITELIELAKEMRESLRRGERLNLSEEELAFYDALETNDSAVKVLGDETLRTIARELVETVKRNVTIDWTVRESVRAKLRTLVKRILRKYGYPPDRQERATRTVLEQAELLCKDWAG